MSNALRTFVRRGRPCKTDIVSGVEASELQLLGQMENSTTAKGRFRRGGERERESAQSIANTKMVIIHLDANRRKTAREGPMPAREDPFLIHNDELCHNPAGREGRGAKHMTIVIIIHLGEHAQNCKGGQEDYFSSTKMNSVTTPREGGRGRKKHRTRNEDEYHPSVTLGRQNWENWAVDVYHLTG